MDHEPPSSSAVNARGAMTSVRSRELAGRSQNGTRVRLLWRQGTGQLWVEVREPDTDRALRIPVHPERALDAFHHPYAYGGLHDLQPPAESLPVGESTPPGSSEQHEQ